MVSLRKWHPMYEDFTIEEGREKGLTIRFHGPWLDTSMYETPVLSIVNEVYYRMQYDYAELFKDFRDRLDDKFLKVLHNTWYTGTFSDFGFRRRLSDEAQELAITMFMRLKERPGCISRFIGTSNVYYAKKHGITAVGTFAHELPMCIGQGNPKHNPAYSNWYTLDAWFREYGVLNGIALTDTITTDCFLRDFQYTFASIFKGVRHDSGDPIFWGEEMLKHYEGLGIDPKSKTLLFSDSLNFKKANNIFWHFRGQADLAYGIGTYITNDTSAEPLNIVIKPVKCNGWPVAKLSDAAGKCMCTDEEYLTDLRRSISRRMKYEA